jgi:hypothetical protein
MGRRVEQLRALSPWEWRLLLGLVLLLPAIGACLRLLGFRRTRDLLARWAPTPPDQPRRDAGSASVEALRVARLVSSVARHGPYRATCLRQSLAVWWLLRRRGIHSTLRIGVRLDQGDLRAHAWVELRGVPVGALPAGWTPFRALAPLSPSP